MRLLKAQEAIVDRKKIVDYLLSPQHPSGRHKATFFQIYGFIQSEWRVLANALVAHACSNDIARREASPFGTRYVIEGPIVTPDGRSPTIRAVWFILHGSSVPQFVTAYPLKERLK